MCVLVCVFTLLCVCVCVCSDWSDEEGPPEEMMEPDDDDQLPTGKIGTKKMKRLQAKIEKKAQREVWSVPICSLYQFR